MPDQRLIDFYSSQCDEAGRLLHPEGRLEFVRVQQLVRTLLPGPPARVLDVGGGTGVHAAWLAQDGHDVTLIDLVPDHVRQARALAESLPHAFAVKVGDARATGESDASADVCHLRLRGPDRRR